MDWLEEIEAELHRGMVAEQKGNAGKARTAARRAVGFAVTELQRRGKRQYGSDVIRQLQSIAGDESLPGEVRNAADRLRSHITQDFTSPSRQPLADARVIINFIRLLLSS